MAKNLGERWQEFRDSRRPEKGQEFQTFRDFFKQEVELDRKKIGGMHLGGMMRLGLAELRGVFFPESNMTQPSPYGLFGTITPGEVTTARKQTPNKAAETSTDDKSVQDAGNIHGTKAKEDQKVNEPNQEPAQEAQQVTSMEAAQAAAAERAAEQGEDHGKGK